MRAVPLPPHLGPDGEPCRGCGAPLAADQRYCLECGQRRGAPRIEFLELLAPVAAAAAGEPAGGPAAAAGAPASGHYAAPAWTLPSPRAAAALILATIVFGSALGTTLGPD